MEIIRTPAEMTAWSDRTRSQGETIALVPTMGYFHAGHLALMRKAAGESGRLVVSLFVNPIQFGPQEDLESYPRDFERDAGLAEEQGVHVLFVPDLSSMYPEGFQSLVRVKKLTAGLCGRNRPGHFEGVTTVVAKLFNIIRPHVAVFGEKDYQQLVVIRRMVNDLAWNIRVIGHPVVREADGLAMSSRNTYLSDHERQAALCLYRALQLARRRALAGVLEAGMLVGEIRELLDSYENVQIEYISLVDALDLTEKQLVDRQTRLVMAVRLGNTRLIDNGWLFEED